MISPYVVQGDSHSICSECGTPIDLLCEEQPTGKKPWFYICWNCKQIFHLGVGKVLRVED